MPSGKSLKGGRRKNVTNKSKKCHIPKHMSRKDKQNLKINLNTLGEKKWFFLSLVTSPIIDTGRIDPITDIPQGDTDQERDGDQLNIRSIEVNWAWAQPTALNDLSNLCRFIVFQWFPNTTPTIASILASTATTTGVLSPYHHDNRFQFKILLDVKTTLGLNSGNSAMIYRKYIKGDLKRKIQYITGGIAGQNKLYVVALSDSTVAAHPNLSFAIKVNYQDN